jgi:NTP pyrophosphatase (non-canonical NTP hydrolase)
VADALQELSELVARFVAERDWKRYHTPKDVAAALSIEAAELQELFLWREPQDRAEDKREQVEDEVADIAICLLNFCQVMEIDLPAAVRRKLAAAELKYPAERVRGRREKYDEYPDYEGDPS